MKEDFKNSDQNVREKLGGMRMTPPADAWAGIEAGITNGGGRKRGFYIWFTLLLIISVTTTGTWYFLNRNEASNTNTSEALATENKSEVLSLEDNKQDENVRTVNNGSTKPEGGEQKASGIETEVKVKTGLANSEFEKQLQANSGAYEKKYMADSKRPNSSRGYNQMEANDRSNKFFTAEPQEISGKPNDLVSNENSKTTETFTPVESANAAKSSNFGSNKIAFSNVSFLSPLEISPLEENFNASRSNNNLNASKARRGGFSTEFGFGASSFRYSATNTVSPGLSQYLKDAQSAELGLNGFARVNYHLNSWFSVHSGVEIQQQNHIFQFENTTTSSYWTADTIGYYFDSISQQQLPIIDSNYITETTVDPQQFSNRETFISIPFGVMVEFPVGIRSEIGVNVSGVLGIRTKASGAILSDENNNSIPIESAYKSTGNLSMRLSLRYSYALTEKNFIYFEPYVGFGLNSRSTPDLPYDARFSNTGIRFGFRRNF